MRGDLYWLGGFGLLYLLLLDFVSTVRIVREAYYQGWRKVLLLGIVWCIPLLGAVTVASILNTAPYPLKGVWAKYPRLSRFLAWLFLIDIERKTPGEYRDGSNGHTVCNGGYESGACHFGDGGACGGGE